MHKYGGPNSKLTIDLRANHTKSLRKSRGIPRFHTYAAGLVPGSGLGLKPIIIQNIEHRTSKEKEKKE